MKFFNCIYTKYFFQNSLLLNDIQERCKMFKKILFLQKCPLLQIFFIVIYRKNCISNGFILLHVWSISKLYTYLSIILLHFYCVVFRSYCIIAFSYHWMFTLFFHSVFNCLITGSYVLLRLFTTVCSHCSPLRVHIVYHWICSCLAVCWNAVPKYAF